MRFQRLIPGKNKTEYQKSPVYPVLLGFGVGRVIQRMGVMVKSGKLLKCFSNLL